MLHGMVRGIKAAIQEVRRTAMTANFVVIMMRMLIMCNKKKFMRLKINCKT
jgi:hypothetical protein